MSGEKKLKGLRGWLILVGVGVVLSPIRVGASLVSDYFASFVDTSALLIVVSLFAFQRSARRAARLDPALALRCE